MSSPEIDPGMPERLEQEAKEIREGIVQVTIGWSNIESAMAILLGTIINDPPNILASAIYFSPGSSDVRFKIVDSVFSALCAKSTLESFDTIIAPWRRLRSRLGNLKGVRNKVAHGQISTLFVNNKNHVRFTAPAFHFGPFTEALKARQLPGLTGNDIKQSAEKMLKTSRIIYKFQPVAKALHESNKEALLSALAEAAASLTTEAPQ